VVVGIGGSSLGGFGPGGKAAGPAPVIIDINLDTSTATSTSSWLIYSESGNFTNPFYRVRFIQGGTSSWSGYGKTGHVVDSNASKTNDHFNDILLNFGTELYRDFIYKVEEKFTHGVKLNLDDFMYMGREIFQEYFDELSIKTPTWFSHKPINDYYTRGKDIWSAKYIQHNKYFTHVKNKNEILLDEERVFGTKMSANRDKKELLQFLPIGVIIEDKGIVRLNREKFLEFIEYQDSWINKIFKG
jgi:hypothetical protein